MDVELIEVEVTVDPRAFPTFNIVGLADRGVEESKERVRASIKASGLVFPQKRIIVNLAPAEPRKRGSLFNLPIAVGILLAPVPLGC